MRKLLLIAAIGFASLAAIPAKAQVSLSINIGSQPQWGPRGYDHVDYYYLPDVESYYYVPTRQFVYFSGNTWIHSRNLPRRYRGYDLYGGRKVVINSPRPWLRHNNYRTQYVSNYNRRPMVVHRGYDRGPGRNVIIRNNNRGRNDFNHGRNDFRARGDNRGRFDGGKHDRGGDHGPGRDKGGRGDRGHGGRG
jgi:hypothetical protein